LRSEVDEIEYPVPADPTDEDVECAQKAFLIHQGEEWPAGTQCINCHVPWPCPLNRWGRKLLTSVGFIEDDFVGMVSRAKYGIFPWII
jgi:hypothetical protein